MKKQRSEAQSHVLTVLNKMGSVQSASGMLSEMGIEFDYPKPLELLEYLARIGSSDGSLILDFFAGSAGLAHAALALCAKGMGNRRFIMVQLPEPSGQAKLTTIAEIGKERLRRAIKSLRSGREPDSKSNSASREKLGFRVLRLSRSNFTAWQDYTGDDPKQLELLFDNATTPLLKDWLPQNVLTEILLLEGFPLDSTVTQLPEHKKNKVQLVESDACAYRLWVCLDKTIKDDTLERLQLAPDDVFVCLDSALTDEAKVRLGDLGNLRVI